jgi:transposase
VIGLDGDLKVVVASKPIDFRRGIHGLVALVSDALASDPYCGDVFIFRSKRLDRLKMIAWDGSGMVLVTKWLEAGRFIWPPVSDGVVRLSAAQMAILVAGLDWTRVPSPIIQKPRIAT